MRVLNIVKKVVFTGAIALGAMFNFAFAAGTPDDTSISNLGALATSINSNAGTVMQIVMIVATLAGLILIIKGLVHLKQNYTGSSQEKHLSKGVASLVFGTALILAIPLSHMLVGTVDTNTSFNTNTGSVSFSSVTP